MATTLLATVLSEPTPQPKQKHRSSGNFSTDGLPSECKFIKFAVKNNPNPDAITFDVKHDISAGIDTTWWKDVNNGYRSNENVKACRTLYIANPAGADGKPFTVEVYAVT